MGDPYFDVSQDARIRAAAFEWLRDQVARQGDVLARRTLEVGLVFEGVRVPLLGPQGIFKPRVLRGTPISITTVPSGPYDDSFGPDGLLSYRYRGTDPDHGDNRGLRFAMEHRLPLVYFHRVVPGKYLASWPIFILKDDPAKLVFTVAVDDASYMGISVIAGTHDTHHEVDMARRMYATAAVRIRLHQRSFRERVLDAYQRQCAFCRLRHQELLDAAHIIPDVEPEGEPHVRNGLALCSLHHVAFDRYFLGLRPDYVLEVRPDILTEVDGPTLVHAIQSLHGTRIITPRRAEQQPSPELLEVRYQRFRQSAL